MAEIAIIGSGIAGLGCAYFLHPHHRVTVFEQDPRPGGHAHTIEVPDSRGRPVAFDTGFMVYNETTYPLLTRLFARLQVPTQPTSMSFSVRHDPSGLEYCGSSLNLLFSQRSNLLRPRFWRFLSRIDRFNRDAVAALVDPETSRIELGEYVRRQGYGTDFLDLYLLPMSCAVWSSPPAKMLRFPAATLLRFFYNHGFLGLHTQHPWRTVIGGARSYVNRLAATLGGRVRCGDPVRQVRRTAEGAFVSLASGHTERFDQVVLACHADQALALLADPDPEESRLLGAFRYERNVALVHTDTSVMPRLARTWASWNYRVRNQDGAARPSTHYWMNRLQDLPGETPFFVSLNSEPDIDPAQVVRRLVYEHPLFDLPALAAQGSLPALNQRAAARRTLYCGSYFSYGFHEDALRSGCAAAAAVLGRDPWQGLEPAAIAS